MGIGKQAKILTNKQQDVVLSFLETTRYPLRNKIIFMLSFKAGLRAKEIANLTWSMVCSSDGKVGEEINLINKASKGQYSGRVIPMHRGLKELLERCYKEYKPDDTIVYSERGRHTSPQAIVNFFQKLYKTVGFEGCSSHSGRRTFITNAAKNISMVGGTLNDVRMLSGHSSLSTTQRYIEYNTQAHKKLIEMV